MSPPVRGVHCSSDTSNATLSPSMAVTRLYGKWLSITYNSSLQCLRLERKECTVYVYTAKKRWLF